jgi:hypothetical protein
MAVSPLVSIGGLSDPEMVRWIKEKMHTTKELIRNSEKLIRESENLLRKTAELTRNAQRQKRPEPTAQAPPKPSTPRTA